MQQMTNGQIAYQLNQIARLLELTDDSYFKVRAYRNAADAVSQTLTPVAELITEGKLEDLPGIGEATAHVIEDLLRTGTSPILQELQERLPGELPMMLQVAGLGPKKVKRIYQELGIKTVKELEAACKQHRIRALSGFGPKTEETILNSINSLNKMPERFPLGIILALADTLTEHIRNWEHVQRADTVGAVRRMAETTRNLNLLVKCEPEAAAEILTRFKQLPMVVSITAETETSCTVSMQLGRYSIPVDLHVIPPEDYGVALVQYTGSKAHVNAVWTRVHEVGVSQLHFAEEAEFYQELGMSFIPPELREDRGETQAAVQDKLPELLELPQIRGDLHMHTTWSDGIHTIEQMAEHARQLGYEYIAITDHSRSLQIARGLSIDKLLRQREEIARLNSRWQDFRIFAGTEMDILPDGTLDYPDEVLQQLDFVIGSVHSVFRQSKEVKTARVIAAIHNPYVRMIGHPTGRLLSRRPAYEIDLEQVFQAAADTGTIIEINCTPNRLDLNDVAAKRAKELGVKLAINTDSHEIDELYAMRLGVGTARRAWLTADDVINAWDRKRLEQFLKTKAPRRTPRTPI